MKDKDYLERGQKTAEKIIAKLEEKADEILTDRGRMAQQFYILGINSVINIKNTSILKLNKEEIQKLQKIYDEATEEEYKEYDKNILSGKNDSMEASMQIENEAIDISEIEYGSSNDFKDGVSKTFK